MSERREDLNQLVKRHIQSVVSNSPAKAVTTLESETSELIGSGMDTLNGKLADVEEEKLVGRVVELWGFFWDQVLPYVEGVRVIALFPSAVVDSISRCYYLSRPIRFYPPCTVPPRHIEILPQQDKMEKAHPFLYTHFHHLPTSMSGPSPCAPSGTKSSSQLPRC